jgi:hypothetical protein
MKENILALAGAIVGGIIGILAFGWLLHRGFYAVALPGGLAGIGAGLTRNHSVWVAVICCVLAVSAGIVAEGVNRPFIADDSFGYFIKHIFEIESTGMVMIVLGGIIGFWIPFRRFKSRPDKSYTS